MSITSGAQNESLLEPEVAPYGAKRRILWLRICTIITFCCLERERPLLCGKNSLELESMPGVRTGFLEARSGSLWVAAIGRNVRQGARNCTQVTVKC